MRCAEALRRAAALLAAAAALVLAACGGGNSSETTIIGGGGSLGQTGPVLTLDQPQGPNTTEVVVDSGPQSGFVLGVTNLPYVTVTVCAPGSTTACATIDHVFLDTGSIGLRVLRSAVAGLNLPPMTAPAGGTVHECFPFVIGAVWGPMARADLFIAGESAAALPVQVIEDSGPPAVPATADCEAAANGGLLKSITGLQAKGVLGIGMLAYDCGLVCESGNYQGSFTLYYTCSAAGACTPAAVPAEQQVRNPVVHFAQNNNGTLIVLPAVPESGASLVKGRLVFGIGTQANNQLGTGTTVLHVNPDPAAEAYLYLTATVGATRYPLSYVDSGSNGLFFNDPALSTACVAGGMGGTWYCPASTLTRPATLADATGAAVPFSLSVANADLLFATRNVAFGNLGGAAGGASGGALVLGLPFFYGRSVYTAIWGQALASSGPWVGF